MKYKIIDVEGIGLVSLILTFCWRNVQNLLAVRLSKRKQASVESSSLLGPTIAT